MIHPKIRLMLVAAAMGLSSTPGLAQQASGFDRMKFVDAVRKEDGGTLRELLDKHGKPILNAVDGKGDTPLTVSIRKRHDWVYFFLAEGADPNLPGPDGDTPLIVAARAGFTGAAEQLLKRKAAVDAENKRGETALIVAVQARQVPIVKLLLEHGANPDETDNFQGRSARDYAKQNTRDRELLTLIESVKRKSTSKPPVSADDFKL
jgi:ankyrin repeat protein